MCRSFDTISNSYREVKQRALMIATSIRSKESAQRREVLMQKKRTLPSDSIEIQLLEINLAAGMDKKVF